MEVEPESDRHQETGYQHQRILRRCIENKSGTPQKTRWISVQPSDCRNLAWLEHPYRHDDMLSEVHIVMRAKFVGVICALLPLTAIAAPDEPSEPSSDSNYPPGWSLDTGAVALAFPRFPGAKDSRYLAVPDIEAHYGDLFFASLREGVGAKLLNWNGFNAGPVVPRDKQAGN